MDITSALLGWKSNARRRSGTKRLPDRNRMRLRAECLEERALLTTILKSGHVHFQMNFSNGAWQPFELENTTTGDTYEPSEVIIFVDPDQKTTQPSGWNFIGAGNGNPYWHMDSSSSSPYVSLSISTENILSGTFGIYQPLDPRTTFAGEWIKLEMRKVTGPGFVSNWQNGQPPNAWWMSSFNGGRTLPAVFYIEPGGHVHLNWGFTAAGIYNVTFEASAFVGGTGLPEYSEEVTLRFGVEAPRSAPIPPTQNPIDRETAPLVPAPSTGLATVSPVRTEGATAVQPSGNRESSSATYRPITATIDRVFDLGMNAILTVL